jgi:hypothetical protein
MLRFVRTAGLAAATLLTVTTAPALAERFTFVALGDMPYTIPQDYPRFERLIARINSVKPSFSVFIGDTKSGSSTCADETLLKTRDLFQTFDQPLVYTIGDNEWTDCHRERAGKFDPLERLVRVRALHFADTKTFGKAPMTVEREADVMPDHKQMVENARWTKDGVIFATLHIVGSNNGLERNIDSVKEFFARDAANTAWINDTFAKAASSNAKGVVFAFQADMSLERDLGELAYANQGFWNTIEAFRKGALAFKKPVLLINGDSHVLKIDQPLKTDKKETIENLTRLQVMGANEIHAVAVTIDTEDPGLFSYRPLIVPENVTNPKP